MLKWKALIASLTLFVGTAALADERIFRQQCIEAIMRSELYSGKNFEVPDCTKPPKWMPDTYGSSYRLSPSGIDVNKPKTLGDAGGWTEIWNLMKFGETKEGTPPNAIRLQVVHAQRCIIGKMLNEVSQAKLSKAQFTDVNRMLSSCESVSDKVPLSGKMANKDKENWKNAGDYAKQLRDNLRPSISDQVESNPEKQKDAVQ